MDGGDGSLGVRRATVDDALAIFDLLEIMHREGRFPPMDDEMVMNGILDAIKSGVIAIVEKNGVLAASLALIPSGWWFSTAPRFVDRWFFVHPDYRNGRAALALIAFAKGFRQDTGIPVFISNLTLERAAAKDRFFGRYLTPVGSTFLA